MLLCWLIKNVLCINNFYVYIKNSQLHTFINNRISERYKIKIELNNKKLDLFNKEQNLIYDNLPFEIAFYQVHVFEGLNNIKDENIIKITLHDAKENKIVHIYKCYIDQNCLDTFIEINDRLLILKYFQTEIQKLFNEFKRISDIFLICKDNFVNKCKNINIFINTIYNDVINCTSVLECKHKEVKKKVEEYKRNSELNNKEDKQIEIFTLFIEGLKRKEIKLKEACIKMDNKFPVVLSILNKKEDYDFKNTTNELSGIQFEHFIIGSVLFIVLCVVILWIKKR